MKYSCLIALLFSLLVSCKNYPTVTTLQVPGYDQYCAININGESIIPNGRIIKPLGEVIRIAPDPFGMVVSPDGSQALAVHNNKLSIIDTQNKSATKVSSPFQGKGSYMGAAIRKDNKMAYLSGGDSGDILYYDLAEHSVISRVTINGICGKTDFKDSFVGDIRLSGDEKRLYILDQFNFRMVILDLDSKKVTGSVPVGRFPLGIDVSPDEKLAYVANTGIFDYPLAPGLTKDNLETAGIDFPPYGLPSKEAEFGVKSGDKEIPGLGSPQVPEAVSVWTIDLTTGQVIAKEKTGFRMGEMVAGIEVEGGSSPNSIAAGKEHVFVTNATNDNVSVLDPKTGKVKATIRLTIDSKIDAFRGLIPFGIVLSKDESKLFVALSGLNCVAVIDVPTLTVIGYIPTGWFPTKLQISPDDKTLYVVTARGYGSGRNAGKGFDSSIAGTYVGDIMSGTFEKIKLDEVDWKKSTQQVKDNTFREVKVADDGKNPLPSAIGQRKSPIKYIVYITKENRTYDEVFGELKKGKGDAQLARYGTKATVMNKDKTKMVSNVNVMPNHQKLAGQFAVSDNFYTDSDASVHGHRWMVGTYPNEWVEINSSMKISENVFSTAPGRKMVAGSSGAVYPEDYNEAGGMWEHLSRHGVNFFNFGLGFEFSGAEEEQRYKFSGVKMGVMFPLPKPLFDRTSRKFATFNTSVPDQFRVDMFEEELKDKWLSGKEEFPSVITMMLPNDHGSSERPADGYAFKESYMADNDLALGRVLHTLSRTKWWANMLVIVTEDDAQDGLDHVDAHRSLLMMMSPWVKKNYVSHTHANFGAILKTIYQINDLPPLNQFDATASLLQDFFTDKPDYTPYSVEMVDQRIFDPQKALDPYDVNFKWESLKESSTIDDAKDFRASHQDQQKKEKSVKEVMNRVITDLYKSTSQADLLKLNNSKVIALFSKEELEILATKHWSFSVNVPVIVSVMWSKEQTPAFWLSKAGFKKTALTMKNQQTTYNVWQKPFEKGIVGLGIHSFDNELALHYFVSVAPLQKSDQLLLSDFFPKNQFVGSLQNGAFTYHDWDELVLSDVPEAMKGQKLLTTTRGRTADSHLVGAFRTTDYPSSKNPDQVILTWSSDPSTSMDIQWRTNPEVDLSMLKFKEKGTDKIGSVKAEKVKLEDRMLMNDRFTNHYTAKIRNLKPGVTYYYQIAPENKWTEEASFTTATKDSTFSFLWFGDTHFSPKFGEILDQGMAAHPDAAFFSIVGDLVSDGLNRNQWDALFEYSKKAACKKPFMSVPGNHDNRAGLGAQLFRDLFSYPMNAPEGVPTEQTYSFTYKNALFLMIDATSPIDAQTAWIERQLATTKAKWKIAMFHFPPFNWEEPYLDIQNAWGPVFDKYHVDMVLGGHIHYYMRSQPIKNGKVVASYKDGTAYIVSVGIPNREHAMTDEPYAVVRNTAGHLYQYVKIEGNKLTFESVNANKKMIDSFSIVK